MFTENSIYKHNFNYHSGKSLDEQPKKGQKVESTAREHASPERRERKKGGKLHEFEGNGDEWSTGGWTNQEG